MFSPLDAEEAPATPRRELEDRPPCMKLLGLLPPYTAEDVHRAYKARARLVHPDRGGQPGDFERLHEAYVQAQEYVRCHNHLRRDWLSTHVGPYLDLQALTTDVEQLGGQIEVEALEWMRDSFGEFATLADRVRRVAFINQPSARPLWPVLEQHLTSLHYLRELDLTGTPVEGHHLAWLRQLENLHTLRLGRVHVSRRLVDTLRQLPDLETVVIDRRSFPWWQRLWTRWQHPQINWQSG